MTTIFLSFLIPFLFLGSVTAQIITDRPDQTESSSTVPVGDLQIESGILIGFTGTSFSPRREILSPTTLFRYGVIEGFELRLLSQFETVRIRETSFQGISDLEIGTKIQIFKKEGVNTEVALLSHLILPSGSSPLSSGYFGTINKLSISHEISENVGLGYNVGWDYFGTGGSGNITYSAALGIGVNDKVGIYIEPYGELQRFNNYEGSFDAGFTYLINPNLQLDFSFGTGINHKMNYISVGASWLIKSNRSIKEDN